MIDFKLETLFLPLEHPQHPIGQREPADDVRSRTDDGDKAENRGHLCVMRSGPAGDYDRTHQRNAGYRVGCRHQRRVQKGRHPRDDLITKKRGQREDIERRDNSRRRRGAFKQKH